MASYYDEPHTFVVEGRGEFPFDMLRHSSACPVTTEDALKLGGTEKRRIAVRAAQLRYVSRERWASFDWPVVDGFDEHGLPTSVDRLPA